MERTRDVVAQFVVGSQEVEREENEKGTTQRVWRRMYAVDGWPSYCYLQREVRYLIIRLAG